MWQDFYVLIIALGYLLVYSITTIFMQWGPVLVGLFAIYKAGQSQERGLNIQAEQLEIAKRKNRADEISRKLQKFYGPYRQACAQTKELYTRFALSLKDEFGKRGEAFRTLIYLVEGKPLSVSDRATLDQILEINKGILKLIESESGLVEKVALHELLAQHSVHIRTLALAAEGKLSGETSAYENIVFPREVDTACESEIRRLNDELDVLSGRSIVNVVSVPSYELSTIDYYNINADQYEKETIGKDMKGRYIKFERELGHKKGRILDAGCGVGRDTRYFSKKGYIVTPIDASLGMVKKCNEYPFTYCTQKSLTEISYSEEFDGVWASASMLHLNGDDAKIAAEKLIRALKPGGVAFVSLKEASTNESDRSGRYFCDHNLESASQLFSSIPRVKVVSCEHSQDQKIDSEESARWIEIVVRKEGLPVDKGFSD